MSRKLSVDKFLNFQEVAQLIGLKTKTVRNGECGTREIPRIKLGGRVLFSLNAVQRWMERKAREAEESKARQEIVVIDLLSEKRRRLRGVQDTLTTIINGGRYK
jgi:predicted DNA-binding transcriptional regulator AlpA